MAEWKGEVASRSEIREQKMRAVLAVASRMFNELGYHGTSLDDIANEVGVTKAALYYYFKNKEQLLYECIQLSYDCGARSQAESMALEGSALQRLVHLYHRFAELLMIERGAFTTKPNVNALPKELQDELMNRRRRLDRYSRELLQAAIDEGSIRPVDVRITSNYFLGAINWILRWYSPDDKRTPGQIASTFVDLMMNGVFVHATTVPVSPDVSSTEIR